MLKTITKNPHLEWFVLGLFIALLLGTMSVHEPWFDESQAWLIARDAPLTDILWVIPHYEGHPPFFHLLLAIPAKLGIGWEWGLRAVGAIFSIASAYLIIFKSPFPRWIRLMLPFTYFLFYQYGVIVRPYNIMGFVMCLLAIYFPQKDERPGLFVGLLAILSACHLYGMAIAGGITVAWLWEIKGNRTWKEYLFSLRKDKRFYWMLGLLGWVVWLMALIWPRPDVFTIDLPKQAVWWQNLLYVTIILPADLFFTNVYEAKRILADSVFLWYSLLSGIVGGCLVWGLICCFLPRKYSRYLVIPYVFLIPLFIYYSSRHHLGLIFLIGLWAFWVAYAKHISVPCSSTRLQKVASFLVMGMLGCCVGWSLFDAYLDYRLTIFDGKRFMHFLQQYNLEDKRIFAMWNLQIPGEWGVSSKLTQEIQDTNFVSFGVSINLYAHKNMIANLNGGGPITYVTHRTCSPRQNEQNFELWRQGGIPDLVVGYIAWNRLFPQQLDLYKDYLPDYHLYSSDIWKYNWPYLGNSIVWAHKDLIEKHQIPVMKDVSFYNKIFKAPK